MILLLWACEQAPTSPTPPSDPPSDSPPDTTTDTCITDDEFMVQGTPLLEDCLNCHVAGGMAASTRYLLEAPTDSEARGRNWTMLQNLISEIGEQTFLEKPSGQQSHGGGQRLEAYSAEYAILAEFAARAATPGSCAFPGEIPPQCNDGQAHPGTAPLRRLTANQAVNSIDALLGVRLDPALFPATTTGNFRTFASLNTVSEAGVEQLMLAAEVAAASLDIPEDLGCTDAESEQDCARRWSLDFSRRAYRRPLTPAEESLATRFLDAGLDVDTALRMQVELALQTPQFWYLDAMPLGETDPAPIDPYQVAARLSYFLTDSPPDALLLQAVESGQFSTPAQISAQASRLAQSPDALQSVSAFHQDWLHLWRLSGIMRDTTLYPTFSDATLEAMRNESDLYVTELVWNGDASWDNLIFGTRSWVNPELAAIYGVPAPSEGWGVAELGPERPGILSRSAWLSAHAYTADSSPVRRGAWLLQMMFCEDLTPPANVNMNLPEASTDLPTIRERLAAHSADPACQSCHIQIDPIGLSFEHFGALGEWRDVWEDGYPVDATASIADPPGDVDGAAELIALLSTSPRLKQCYAQRVFEYAVGRGAELEDTCTLNQLSERFEVSGGNLHQLWVDISLTDAFLYRHALEQP